jgi:uncharacterized membrane protein YhiD involved in acid resistance
MTELDLALTAIRDRSLPTVVFDLLLALVLGIVVSVVYQASVNERVRASAMQASLALLSMISAMVMMVIGDSIARAFSLVGALAIIRFRTRLRSPWDISFVFFALAVGIACGVGVPRIALAGTGLISIAVLILHTLHGGVSGAEVQLLRCDVAAYDSAEANIGPILEKHLKAVWLDEVRSIRFGETMSYRYRIQLRPGAKVEELVAELSTSEGVERVVFSTEMDSTAS